MTQFCAVWITLKAGILFHIKLSLLKEVKLNIFTTIFASIDVWLSYFAHSSPPSYIQFTFWLFFSQIHLSIIVFGYKLACERRKKFMYDNM